MRVGAPCSTGTRPAGPGNVPSHANAPPESTLVSVGTAPPAPVTLSERRLPKLALAVPSTVSSTPSPLGEKEPGRVRSGADSGRGRTGSGLPPVVRLKLPRCQEATGTD